MGDFLLNLTKLLQARSYLAAAAVVAFMVLIIRLFGLAEIISQKEAAWIYIIGGFCFLVLLFQEGEPYYVAYQKNRQEEAKRTAEADRRRKRGLDNLPAATRQQRWCLEYLKRFHPQRSFAYGQNAVILNMVDLCLLDYGDPDAIYGNIAIYRVPDHIWEKINARGWTGSDLPLELDELPWDRNRRI